MLFPGSSRSPWPGTPATQVLELPLLGPGLRPRPPYLPPALPADLAARISRWVEAVSYPVQSQYNIRLHGAPAVWWVGQVLQYVWRPQPRLAARLQAALDTLHLGPGQPILGVHIR